MYVCNYCGRHLKKKYDSCPGCGSDSLKYIQNIDVEIIKEPPKDGYKTNIENYRHIRKGHIPFTVFALIFIFFGIIIAIPFFTVSKSFQNSDLGMMIIFPAAAAIFLIVMINKVWGLWKKTSYKIINSSNKDINKVKYLSKHGMLIKNLNYTIKPLDNQLKGPKTVYVIQVIYEIEKGKTKCFISEPKYLTALGRDDGTVDLLVDPNDYTNYFIDFEIY